VFRGLVLCLCLNLSYANVVRFPRELDRYGSAYLVPYVVLLFLVGLPMVLLEISVGQFLGQGAAHTWRASPIFKGEFRRSSGGSILFGRQQVLRNGSIPHYCGRYKMGPKPKLQLQLFCIPNCRTKLDGESSGVALRPRA